MVDSPRKRAYDKEYYARNKVRIRERKRIYRVNNLEKVRQQDRESYWRCREQRLIDMKNYKKNWGKKCEERQRIL